MVRNQENFWSWALARDTRRPDRLRPWFALGRVGIERLGDGDAEDAANGAQGADGAGGVDEGGDGLGLVEQMLELAAVAGDRNYPRPSAFCALMAGVLIRRGWRE